MRIRLRSPTDLTLNLTKETAHGGCSGQAWTDAADADDDACAQAGVNSRGVQVCVNPSLHEGGVQQCGATGEVLDAPANAYVQALVESQLQ